MKRIFLQLLVVALLVILVGVMTTSAQESEPVSVTGDTGGAGTEVNVAGSGEVTTDTSALSQPVTEIREIIPYGKAEAHFGYIVPQPAGIAVPPATPIVVRLLATKAPKLNEAIHVTLQVHAFSDAPETIVEMQLPEGAEVLEGSTQAEFDLLAGQRQEVTAAVVFRQPGEKAILGRALSTVSPDMIWGDMDALYLAVEQDVGFVGYRSGAQTQLTVAKVSDDTPNLLNQELLDEEALVEEAGSIEGLDREGVLNEEDSLAEDDLAERPNLENPPFQPEVQESPENAGPAVTVTISVCWILGSDRDGSTPPLRDAHIQLWDDDIGADDFLASGYTGYTSGCRSFTLDNADSDECCTIDAYIRVRLSRAGRYQVTNYGGGVFFAQTSTQFNIGANHNFGTWWVGGGSGNDRSVRIYNDLYRSLRFIREHAVLSGMGAEPGQVTVLWETGGTDGTYYNLNDNKVHLEDADAGFRDVVVHEAAHSYMDSIYSAFPPSDCPSPHFITGVSGKYCAWTEGYTYIFTAAADGNPVYDGGFLVNLESPRCNSAGWDDGPRVEGRVGGLLIDLADPFLISFGSVSGFGNEPNTSGCAGRDDTSGMFDGVWDLLYDQDDQVVVTLDGVTNSFSNAWEARQYARYAPHLVGHHNTIDFFTHD